MEQNYSTIIKKVDTIIKKNGIPYYLNKWEKISIPKNFESYGEFYRFLNKYVKSYHFHSFIFSNFMLQQFQKDHKQNKFEERPMPKFKWDNKNKIGTIKLYHFISAGREQTILDEKKMIKLVEKHYQIWNKKNISGLIIDLREHTGGDMWPAVKSLKDVLGNTTLLSFNTTKTKYNERRWINLKNGNKKGGKFITNSLNFKKPIVIIISNNTTSSGEFIAAIFKGRSNTIFLGDHTTKTGGALSVNWGTKVNNDLTLLLTVSLCTTVDGKFHVDEYLTAKYSENPDKDAEQWINKNKYKV